MTYPNRYEHEPRKRKVYESACDMINYTTSEIVYFLRIEFKDVNKSEMEEIWNVAYRDINGMSTVDFIYDVNRIRKRKGRRSR